MAAAAGMAAGGNMVGQLGSSLIGGLFANAASKRDNETQRYMQQQDQAFYNQQRDYMQQQYLANGVPWVPGLTNSGSSPLPTYTQQIGSRAVHSAIPGLAPRTGVPNELNMSFAPPLLR